MPEDITNQLLSVYFFEGVDALKYLAHQTEKNKDNIYKIISADLFPIISHYNNDPYMIITSAHVAVGSYHVLNILSIIENRLLDALILLESEFGNLDELDIDVSSKSPEEIDKILNKIVVIIYNDHSIDIGDGNKIKDSTIASIIKSNENL